MTRSAILLLLVALMTSAHCASEPRRYTICAWNIQNFGVTDRHIDGRRVRAGMKPAQEIRAMTAILKRINPDILGVSEILQDPEDKYLKLLQRTLQEAGLDYPHVSTTRGEDSRIQCALFSRYPFDSVAPLEEGSYEATIRSKSTGETLRVKRRMERGITHALVRITSSYAVRVLHIHLKSRRPFPEIVGEEPEEPGEAFVRRQEAVLVKGTMNRLLQKNPREKLILMGDFNDTPRSRAFKTLLGPKDASVPCYDLWLTDWLGDWWTHYYILDRQYERIDYMMVSQSLFQDWVSDQSYIWRQNQNDPAEYNSYTPSDHRALVAVFRSEPQAPTKP